MLIKSHAFFLDSEMGKKSRRRSRSDDEEKEDRWKKRFRHLEKRIEEQNSFILKNINRCKLCGYSRLDLNRSFIK